MHFIASASFLLGFLAVASAQTCNGTTCDYAGSLCCSVDEVCYTDAYGRPRCSVSSMIVTQIVTTTQIGVWTSAWSEISNGGGGSGSALYTCSSEGSESGAGLYTCASDFGPTSVGMVSLGDTESTSSVTVISSVLTTDTQSVTSSVSSSEVRIAPTPGSASSGASVGMCWYRVMGAGTVFAVVFML
jgi:hypothetical protein